ncbi:MAG TPA: hypothetical protein VFS03_04210 [Microvirga sp.]|nr:hypothetical protein [Microvirga sp.]
MAGGSDERRDRAIDRLPSNATEPGGAPRPTEEPGGAKRGGKTSGGEDVPPAGPHAEPGLTNPDSTPGAGTLTPPGEHDDVDSTSG